MKMWIARAQDNVLSVFREKPFLLEIPELKCAIWVYEEPCGNVLLGEILEKGLIQIHSPK
jgi:hypothetical protein